MSSLRDKLRMVSQPKERVAPLSTQCHHSQTVYEAFQIPFERLKAETLYALSGQTFFEDVALEEVMFFDTETTGLSRGAGTLAFLLGMAGFTRQNRFVVEQSLMRDYHEEVYVLNDWLERLKTTKLLITYNGAAFDLPLMEGRLIMQRLQKALVLPPHIDLLHAARRVYKLRLGRCTLSAMEKEIYGLERADDLPGAEIPQRYFEFLKTGELSMMEQVLAHNAQDLVSLARLTLTLVQAHENPLSLSHGEDLYSLGAVFEKRGNKRQAGACYRACMDGKMGQAATLRLANLSRRSGEPGEAAALYEKLRARGEGGVTVYISLAKVYEHRFKQPDKALAIVRSGMLYCLEHLNDENPEKNRDYQDLCHRHSRLLKKVRGVQHGIHGRD